MKEKAWKREDWNQKKDGLVQDEEEGWSVKCKVWLSCSVNQFKFHHQVERSLLLVMGTVSLRLYSQGHDQHHLI